mmetsp:Transcript_25224/g.79548  ORF Transcript_25224/g.79548 Transcript_25224/m.79548 type:complete len:268 (-) Transcript_25224:386-1189(-)
MCKLEVLHRSHRDPLVEVQSEGTMLRVPLWLLADERVGELVGVAIFLHREQAVVLWVHGAARDPLAVGADVRDDNLHLLQRACTLPSRGDVLHYQQLLPDGLGPPLLRARLRGVHARAVGGPLVAQVVRPELPQEGIRLFGDNIPGHADRVVGRLVLRPLPGAHEENAGIALHSVHGAKQLTDSAPGPGDAAEHRAGVLRYGAVEKGLHAALRHASKVEAARHMWGDCVCGTRSDLAPVRRLLRLIPGFDGPSKVPGTRRVGGRRGR